MQFQIEIVKYNIEKFIVGIILKYMYTNRDARTITKYDSE